MHRVWVWVLALACSGCSILLDSERHAARDGAVDSGARDGGTDGEPVDAGCRNDQDCFDPNPCDGPMRCNSGACEPAPPTYEYTECTLEGGGTGVCRYGSECVPRCSNAAPFLTLLQLGPEINTSGVDFGGRLSVDERTLYFSRRNELTGDNDLYMATRASVADEFGAVRQIPDVNDNDVSHWWPTVSGDGLTLYAGGNLASGNRIFKSTRASVDADFPPLTEVGALESFLTFQEHPYVLPNNRTMYFGASVDTTEWDIYRVSINADGSFGTPSIVFGAALALPGVLDWAPAVTPDELTMYFASTREGGRGGYDIYLASRDSTSAEFGPPVALNVNDNENDLPTWISPDNCELYFEGGYDIWVATRTSTGCTLNEQCSDQDVCNGEETCDTGTGECRPGTTPLMATSCATFGSIELDGVCRAGVCSRPCNVTSPFTAIRPYFGDVTTADEENGGRLSADELTLYFHSCPTIGNCDIYTATRPWRGLPFGVGTALPRPPNTDVHDFFPTVTADGRSLYVGDQVGGAAGSFTIKVASRAALADTFSQFTAVTALNSTADLHPYVLPDNSAIYFTRDVGFDHYHEIFRAAQPFTMQAAVAGADLSTTASELAPVVTPDELTLYFASSRAPSLGGYDMYVVRRMSTSEPFGPAAPVMFDDSGGAGAPVALSGGNNDFPTWTSPDACELLFASGIPGETNLYLVTRTPP